jgi:hypothetical protein
MRATELAQELSSLVLSQEHARACLRREKMSELVSCR